MDSMKEPIIELDDEDDENESHHGVPPPSGANLQEASLSTNDDRLDDGISTSNDHHRTASTENPNVDVDMKEAVKDEINISENKTMDENGSETGTKSEQQQEEVQVLSPQQAERELRRKRRKRIYRLLKRPDQLPSFLAVVRAEPKGIEEQEDDDDEEDIPPPVVVIDVDAYLGLKAKPTPSGVLSTPAIVPSDVSSSETARFPRRIRSADAGSPSTTPSNPTIVTATTTPAEEGWYEGSRVMAMPEDSTFLGDMHVWVRQHLEFFSATELDVQHSQAGRRTKAVRGKVGIRCIHCARNVMPKIQQGDTQISWPAAAVTYPNNYAGLYSGASQKPQLHFETCPYLPKDSQLANMLQEARANQQGNAPLTGMGKRKRMVQGVSGLMYYVISCQRIGLQEVGDRGLRFTRDLALEPLEFESVRIQVERERPELIPRQYQAKSYTFVPPTSAKIPRMGLPDTAASLLSSSSDAPSVTSKSAAPAVVSSDATAQAVLQKTLEEPDDPTHRIIRRSDKKYLTDYMYLAIAQMAICHASPQDFSARGKKTKLMRMGLAGFCCRHCQYDNSVYSCRSFSSAADNLASAISNSFVLHLQKCPYTPREIQTALSATKRIHTKQMGQMPYGSQRKMFFEIWDRMRAADKPAPAIKENEEQGDDTTPRNHEDGDQEWNPAMENDAKEDEDDGSDARAETTAVLPTPVVSSTVMDSNRPNARGDNFPVSNDAETNAILKKAESTWDPAMNDYLIMPEDRYLVSDYVFLTMRQVKVAMPTPSDFRGNRRNNIVSRLPGMCCIHCKGDPSFHGPSGRSFPSAPDNMACALNSSFYNHMQHCPYLEPSLKCALANLRKIHSQQCSNLIFGSQRRFFNKVYDKLKRIPLTSEQLASFSGGGSTSKSSKTPKRDVASPVVDDQILRENNFVPGGTIGIPYWQCLRCRMVPFELRSIGAVHYVRPHLQHLKQHNSICQKDSISLGWVNTSIRELFNHYKQSRLADAIRPLIKIVVGNDPGLTELFMDCVISRGVESENRDSMQAPGMWRKLPSSIDWNKLKSSFETFSQVLDLQSSKLVDHPKILRMLEIMSPSLQIQGDDEQTTEHDKKATSALNGGAEADQGSSDQVVDNLAQAVEGSIADTETVEAGTSAGNHPIDVAGGASSTAENEGGHGH